MSADRLVIAGVCSGRSLGDWVRDRFENCPSSGEINFTVQDAGMSIGRADMLNEGQRPIEDRKMVEYSQTGDLNQRQMALSGISG